MVKPYSSTVELPLKLFGLSIVEAGGMYHVAVKCLEMIQNADCEDSSLNYYYTEARKRGYRTGLDTLVVHALNDEH